MVPSEAVPFVYLASVSRSHQCLISALTQAGGGGLLFRLLVPSRCAEGLALLPRLRCSGSRLLCVERALRCARFQPSVLHKSADSAAPVFCAFPARAAQAARSLTGALPRVRRAFCPPRSQPHFLPVPVGCTRLLPSAFPSPNPHLRRSGACILCLAATLPADVDHPESQEVFD